MREVFLHFKKYTYQTKRLQFKFKYTKINQEMRAYMQLNISIIYK